VHRATWLYLIKQHNQIRTPHAYTTMGFCNTHGLGIRCTVDIDKTSHRIHIAELEQKMFHHAELLEFEEAASARDQIKTLRDRVLKQPDFG